MPQTRTGFARAIGFAYGRRQMRLAVLSLVTLAALATPAFAHQTSVKPVELHVDGATARISLKAGNGDVAEALHLPPDAAPDPAQIAAGADAVARLVTRWAVVSADGAPCPPTAASAVSDARDSRFVDIRWEARCARDIRTLTVDFAGLFELDPTQSVMLRLTAPDAAPLDTIIAADQSPLTVTLGETTGLLAFVRHGIEHILYGYDHVAFVLALLLVVILARGPSRWEPRPLTSALRATALIVSSFTIAHSLTLIAASLGWVSLPSRLVESAIALSIAYTAIENVVRPDVRWRFVLTFAFGLMHGLGFASVLADLLPPDDVVVPLLAFNVGVELGQLMIVAVTLPLLTLLCRAIGADRYRRIAMPLASGAIAILGLLWLVERVAGVTIVGF